VGKLYVWSLMAPLATLKTPLPSFRLPFQVAFALRFMVVSFRVSDRRRAGRDLDAIRRPGRDHVGRFIGCLNTRGGPPAEARGFGVGAAFSNIWS
jgi:hypothetical protein